MQKKPLSRDFITFLPLLCIYIVLILTFSKNELGGDETRYVRYAKYLTQGYFIESDNPTLENGPGYPLILAPFVGLDINPIVPKLLNALFVFLGIVYFKNTLSIYLTTGHSIKISYILGFYPPLIRWSILLYSEPFTFFLICGFIYHTCNVYHIEKQYSKQILLASLYVGYLVLTKVVFLQVISVSLVILSITMVKKVRKAKLISLYILMGGFVLIFPYLIYAFMATGKPFYLGTVGGEILYYRSTPFENEYGNWFATDDVYLRGKSSEGHTGLYFDLTTLSKNHIDFYKKLEGMSSIERDSAFEARAIENMTANPKKYLINTTANVGRLLFHYPFSYREQNLDAYGYMIPNMFLIVFWILSLYAAFKIRFNLPFEILFLMAFALIYMSGLILLDGRGRNFIEVVPFMVLFICYAFFNILNIKIKSPEFKKNNA